MAFFHSGAILIAVKKYRSRKTCKGKAFYRLSGSGPERGKTKLSRLLIRNIRYHRSRYRYIGILTALMTLFTLSGAVLVSGVKAGILTARNRLGADLVVLPAAAAERTPPEDIFVSGVPETMVLDGEVYEEVRSLEGVTVCVPRIYLATLPQASCCDGEIQLIGTETEKDFLLSTWADTEQMEDDEIILGYQFRNIGKDTVHYLGREFRVREILEKTNTGYDSSGFITMEKAREIVSDPAYAHRFSGFGPSDISALFLSAEDPKTMNAILKSRFGNSVEIYAADKRLSEYTGTVNLLQGFTGLVSGLLAVIEVLSLFTVASIATQSRRNEIGSMMTVGCTAGRICLLFTGEQTLVVFLSTLLSAAAAAGLQTFLAPVIESSLSLPLSALPLSRQVLPVSALLAGNCLTGALSAFSAVHSVCRTSPACLIKEAM